MPELPEVQNTVEGIARLALKKTITDVWSDYDSSFYYGKRQIKDPAYFRSKEEVKKTMPFSDPFNDFIHVVFTLENDMQLAFSDMRKFATMTLLENQKEIQTICDQYGPEPLESGQTKEKLFSEVRKKPTKKIKTALLDQSLIAGYGNIYTDEVLFITAIHPESQVGAIPEEKWQELFEEGRKLLKLAIKHGGDSMGDYRRIDGTGGNFHDMHQMYQKEKTPCNQCGEIIIKKQIDQRVGRLCLGCQIYYSL